MRYSPERFSRYARELQRALIETSMDLPSDWIRNGAKVNETPIPAVTLIEQPKVEILPPTKDPVKSSFIGASSLASLIRNQQAKIKEQFAKAGEDLVKVISEGQQLADAATNQVKAAKAEVADLKAALGLNSNAEPE